MGISVSYCITIHNNDSPSTPFARQICLPATTKTVTDWSHDRLVHPHSFLSRSSPSPVHQTHVAIRVLVRLERRERAPIGDPVTSDRNNCAPISTLPTSQSRAHVNTGIQSGYDDDEESLVKAIG